jgi:hypothetical protein
LKGVLYLGGEINCTKTGAEWWQKGYGCKYSNRPWLVENSDTGGESDFDAKYLKKDHT